MGDLPGGVVRAEQNDLVGADGDLQAGLAQRGAAAVVEAQAVRPGGTHSAEVVHRGPAERDPIIPCGPVGGADVDRRQVRFDHHGDLIAEQRRVVKRRGGKNALENRIVPSLLEGNQNRAGAGRSVAAFDPQQSAAGRQHRGAVAQERDAGLGGRGLAQRSLDYIGSQAVDGGDRSRGHGVGRIVRVDRDRRVACRHPVARRVELKRRGRARVVGDRERLAFEASCHVGTEDHHRPAVELERLLSGPRADDEGHAVADVQGAAAHVDVGTAIELERHRDAVLVGNREPRTVEDVVGGVRGVGRVHGGDRRAGGELSDGDDVSRQPGRAVVGDVRRIDGRPVRQQQVEEIALIGHFVETV